MNSAFFALSRLNVVRAVSPLSAAAEIAQGGSWRPPEWQQAALTSLTVPGTSAPATAATVTDDFLLNPDLLPGAPAFPGEPTRVYVFDAILRAEHSRELRRTEHPIQSSSSAPVASITDHAFLLPARVTLEIGMSDAMESYDNSNWSGSLSKSVSAYQLLVKLQQERTLVTLSTRLDTYANMVLETISSADDVKTRHGLRAMAVFSQIFLADVTAVSSGLVSNASQAGDRPQTTGATPTGAVQAETAPASLISQYQVPASIQNQASAVPGAGNWSSVSVSRLGGFLG